MRRSQSDAPARTAHPVVHLTWCPFGKGILMSYRTFILLSACSLTLALPLALPAETTEDVDLPKLIADAAKYQTGQNVEPLRKIEQLLRHSAGKPAVRAELEAALVKLLAPSATLEARRFACQLLMVIGTDASLPALADLLKCDETVGIACLALSSQRSSKANELLRSALSSARSGASSDHRGPWQSPGRAVNPGPGRTGTPRGRRRCRCRHPRPW